MNKALTAAMALCLSLVGSTAGGQPVVDGVVDTLYGAAVASDKAGDGNGQAVMDLRKLYLWHDATDLYVTFTIEGDVTAPNSDWGKYVIYIDTTSDSQGATADPWQRDVVALDPHKPEYSINTWVDEPSYNASRVEVWGWSGGSWTKNTATVTAAALSASSQGTVFEYRVPLTLIGSPSQIWLEVWSTSGTTSDNAQDTLNNPAEDWNATDWTTQAQLKVTTSYSLAPPPDAGVPDATPPDSGAPDSAAPDSAAPDSAAPDSAAPDSAAPDSAVADSAVPDGEVPDAAGPDLATPDMPLPDGAAPDMPLPPADASAALDSAASDTGAPDASPSDAPPGDAPASPDAGVADDLSAAADITPSTDGEPPAADRGATGKTLQDEGCSCALETSPRGAVPAALLLALLLALRRRG